MATYYVDPVSGSDSNAGTSFGAAFATIGKAETVVAAGDTVRICATGNHTLTSAVSLATSGDDTSGPITYVGANSSGAVDGTRPTITSATNSVNLVSLNGKSRRVFDSLKFTHTAGTRGSGIIALTGQPNYIQVTNCLFDGCLNGLQCGNIAAEFSANYFVADNCEFKNCTQDGVQLGGTEIEVRHCYIHGNTRDGARVGGGLQGGTKYYRCIIAGNGGKGINLSSNGTLAAFSAENCTIVSNTSDGIASAITTANPLIIRLENNIIHSNGGYGVTLTNSAAMVQVNRNNAYGSSGVANTSGARNNLSAGTNDVTLTADTSTNAASGDYSLNTNAGGGAACRAAGFPGTFPAGTTTGYVDIGAVQHADSGSSGGMMTPIETFGIEGVKILA